MMDKEILIKKAEAFIRERTAGEPTGHDYWHADRVRKTALRIARAEKADPFITGLSALLHDAWDRKIFEGGELEAAEQARRWLAENGADGPTADAVLDVIAKVSFKGAGVTADPLTPEGRCVQDADRLDAMGAIGIARAFAFGGSRGRPIYEPGPGPVLHESYESYKNGGSHTINHFYEKLLLLKDRMNTPAGRRMAKSRHRLLEKFLKEFIREWNG